MKYFTDSRRAARRNAGKFGELILIFASKGCDQAGLRWISKSRGIGGRPLRR